MRTERVTGLGRAHLDALFEQEADRIFGFLVTRSGSSTLAEDLVGEVFAEAARRCAQGRRHEVTGAWLQTVARRRLVDHWRRTTTQRRLGERLRHTVGHAVRDHSDDGNDGRVLASLDSLPDRQRAALCLRYLDDFSVSEVADALGIAYQAAESLLARARRSFARAYEEVS